jgi:hypothetical protein
LRITVLSPAITQMALPPLLRPAASMRARPLIPVIVRLSVDQVQTSPS